jgi:hypothetical protein
MLPYFSVVEEYEVCSLWYGILYVALLFWLTIVAVHLHLL